MDLLLKKIPAAFLKHYRADLRSLALMRIGIALVVMADLLIRSSDLKAFYTDEGIWPTSLLHNFGWQNGFWSLHALSGSFAWIAFLFALHLLAAIFLLLGYQTTIATVLVWLLTVSLHNRNVFILQAGDDLLRLVLLWGCFLPWQSCYSLDARKPLKTRSQGLAGPAYFMLIASVYLFSALLKSGTEWRTEGSAVYYALSLEQLRLPISGDWLYQFPVLMRLLTRFVFYAELAIPLLVLWPSEKGRFRLFAFILIIVLHAGIGATLYVGLFFVISMVSAIGLLPAFAMDRLESIFPHKKTVQAETARRPVFRIINAAAVSILIVLSLIINLGGLSWFNYKLHRQVSSTANALRLNQYWGMFSPVVMKNDGWFVYYGMDAIGRQWDLKLNQDYVDFKKPAHIVSDYKNDRWRKLAENMQDSRFTFLHPLYCQYVLKQWNLEHPEKKLATLNLYFMQKTSMAGYRTTDPEKKLFCVCTQ